MLTVKVIELFKCIACSLKTIDSVNLISTPLEALGVTFLIFILPGLKITESFLSLSKLRSIYPTAY